MLALSQLRPALTELLEAVAVRRLPVGELLQGVGELGLRLSPALLVLVPALVQLLPGVRQLDLGIRQFLLAPGQLPPAPIKLGLAIPQLPPGLGDLGRAGVIGGLALVVVVPALRQLGAPRRDLRAGGLQLGALPVQFRLGSFQPGHGSGALLFAHKACGNRVLNALPLRVQLGLSGLQLRLAGGQLLLRCVQQGLVLLQLPPSALQLVPGVRQLGLPDSQLPLALPELRLAAGDLLLGILQLPHAVVVRLQAVLVLPLPVGELGQGVRQLGLRLGLAAVVLVPALVQLPPGVRQLPLAVVQLLLGVRHLLLGVVHLLLAVGELPQALGVVPAALLIVPLALGVLRLAVGELPVGVVQLRLRIGALGAVLVPAVGNLPLRVGDLLQGVAPNLVVALLGPPVCQLLHRRLDGVDLVPVLDGVGQGRVVHGEENLVVGLEVEAPLGYVYEPGHAAPAQGAGTPVVVEVVGGPAQAHHGVRPPVEQIPRLLLVALGHGEHRAQHLLREVAGVGQTLVVRLGHPPGGQGRLVQAGGEGVGPEHHLPARLHLREEVGVHRPPGRRHPVQGGEVVHVLLGEAQGGEQPEVVEAVLRQVVQPRGHHGRLAGAQPREEAYAQPHDGQNGQIAPQALPDLPQGGAQKRPYHSISSTGTGRSLISTPVTVPFFTWITRSAMAVRALLWVMMMTVIPFFRLIIWRSFKMALPVL